MKYLLSFVLLFSFQTQVTFDLPKPAIKKINKSLLELWPETELDIEKLALSKGNTHYYSLKHNDVLEGILALSKAPSKFDLFDYMVIFNPKGEIIQSKVLIYREDYGGEIGSKRWMKQFVGKSAQDNFRLGDDIQGVSGATISCRAAVEGIGSLTKEVQELIH